jgi:hypothetical protein
MPLAHAGRAVGEGKVHASNRQHRHAQAAYISSNDTAPTSLVLFLGDILNEMDETSGP